MEGIAEANRLLKTELESCKSRVADTSTKLTQLFHLCNQLKNENAELKKAKAEFGKQGFYTP
jgi:hypothetical protein